MTVRDPFVDARTSVELWELLQTDAGLQPGDYDEHLDKQLRGKLGLGTGPMADELASHAVSVERFVAAFFVVAEPFVRMWSDLLVLFERATATAGDVNLRVEYRFGEEQPPLDFDLSSFRSVLATAERVMARFDLSGDDLPSRLWAVFGALDDRPRFGSPTGFDDVDRFARSCEDRGAPWPEAMPERRTSGLPELDGLLAEAWELAEVVLSAIRSISSSYNSLMELPRDDERPVGASGAARSKLRVTQSDFWLPTVVVALTRAAVSPPPSTSAPGSAVASEASGPDLLPPESDTSLATYVKEGGYAFTGVTHIELVGSKNQVVVTNSKGETETLPWPANGLIYVKGSSTTACKYEYLPDKSDDAFDKTLSEESTETNCGNVYVKGTYSSSLTIGAEENLIINGNIYPTSVAGSLGSEPTGTATLGLIASDYVRIYHPLTASNCSSGAKNEKSSSLYNPWVYAAILSTSHSFVVDNFDCGEELGKLHIYGAIAQRFRGIVGTTGGTGYIKDYKYDERLAVDEPHYFLNPINAGWEVARETAPEPG